MTLVSSYVMTFGMSDRLALYPKDYDDSRARFRALVDTLSEPKTVGQWSLPSRIDEDLTVDFTYFPATEKAERLIVLISGTHGPEGYVGSAIQQLFLKEFWPRVNRAHAGFLLVHALNPYGFRHLQRCTENRVNLNRNCSVRPEMYEIRNEKSVQLSRRFIPVEPVQSLKSQLIEHKKIVDGKVFFDEFSLDDFIKTISPGQFESPDALEFGGFGPEPQIKMLTDLLIQVIPEYRDIIALDLHTGLGERGRLHLLSDNERSLHLALFRELFHEDEDREFYEHTPNEKEGFYSVYGATNNLFSELGAGDQRVCALTMEFGTLGMSAEAQMDSLNQWMLDHQASVYGYARPELQTQLEALRKERSFPRAPEWRESVLKASAAVFEKLFTRVRAL